MSAEVIRLPGLAPARTQATGLNLSPEEVQEAAGGYVYPARQLRELHARGFALATIGKCGRVVLPRAHYEAVLHGQYRQQPEKQPQRPTPRANRDGLMDLFGAKRRK